jgi:hypothetical protein
MSPLPVITSIDPLLSDIIRTYSDKKASQTIFEPIIPSAFDKVHGNQKQHASNPKFLDQNKAVSPLPQPATSHAIPMAIIPVSGEGIEVSMFPSTISVPGGVLLNGGNK